MNSVGAEVGQKMRSAIKAKLLELHCYVDDELPDYIMVMVANRRTKAQMNEDLYLFLNEKTSPFVEWLHIVLKKLKEVTVTNPEVYKKVAKRKSSEEPDIKIKKEKFKKYSDNVKSESNSPKRGSTQNNTDEETSNTEFSTSIFSEMNSTAAKDLEEIERKIRNVKSRLGITVDSDVDEEMLIKLKTEKVKTETPVHKENSVEREVELQIEDQGTDPMDDSDHQTSYTPEKPKRPSPITFEKEDFSTTPPRKSSVLSRLGKRVSSSDTDSKKRRLSLSDAEFKSRKRGSDRHSSKDEKKHKRSRNDRDRSDGRRSDDRRVSRSKRDSIGSEEARKRSDKSVHSRLGVMSKIHIPEKPSEEPEIEDELRTRAVRSMVKVKPRSLPAISSQPNKNLLLKAVAEANKSVSETISASSKTFPRLSEDSSDDAPSTRKLSKRSKSKIRNIILAQVSKDGSDTNDEEKEFEYVPKPIKRNNSDDLPEYVPSSRKSIEESLEKETAVVKPRISAKARLSAKKSPSPIFFDNVSTKVSKKIDVPDSLLTVHPPASVKTQERCKYWPNCRQGDKCEFVHPSAACEAFPNCKYGEKCMFLHPSCKFGASCTKRDCQYSHANSASLAMKLPVVQPQICRFFPKCTNITCPFFHPKLCKFGKYCKNQAECPFSHPSSVKKSSLTWRPK
ncbi:unnamed protein product [Diabrotica balteata]|uniref:Zinc finger CCCH domain-containing protein 14 n=1 Tax=Diabrotica balteata TaxID=107213 RepID=A0A9N9X922_DIABA|nr:unnamed protein product [Diabrotica balteata]